MHISCKSALSIRMKTSFLPLLALCVIAVVPIGKVSAATLSYTNTSTASGLNNFTNLNLSKFDSDLGTLTGVQVTVISATFGGSFIIGSPALDQDYEGAAGRLTIRGGTNALGFTTIGETLYNVTTTPAPIVTIPGGATNNFIVDQLVAISNSVSSISNSFWAAYEQSGGGTISFESKNRPDITISGGDFFLNATAFTLETKMSVTYSFTPVPEPSTIALLALSGLGAAAFAVRRRRCRF